MNESIFYTGLALTGIAIVLIWLGVILVRPKIGVDPYRQPSTQPPATVPAEDTSSGDAAVPGEKGGRRRFDN